MYQPKKYTCNDAVFRPFLVDTMVHVPLSTKKILDSFLVYTVKHQQKEIDWDFILGYDLPVSTFSEKSQLLLYPVITLDTVNFTECDPMLRITTLLFSESISPLSETDDVVHNIFLSSQCIRYCDVIHIAPYKIYKAHMVMADFYEDRTLFSWKFSYKVVREFLKCRYLPFYKKSENVNMKNI